MKALVTGGKGFIGSHLSERLLSDGHSVIVLDLLGASSHNIKHLFKNRNLDIVPADIRHCEVKVLADLMRDENVNWVFHLAGLADIVPSINNPIDYFETNVLGTLNVLEAARLTNIKKFVYASSSSVYGVADQIPTPEHAPIKPQYPYAESKYQGERWVNHYDQIYGLPTISLRLFNVYGPRSRTTGAYGAVFGIFLAQKINSKPFTIVGDGKQSRDFVFVTDVCDAFVRSAESKISGKVFNVGACNPQTILRLTELLEGEIAYMLKRPGEPDITCADISNIRRMLNWDPKVSFETGVKIMLDNIDYWKDAPIWTPEAIGEATKNWFRFLTKPSAGETDADAEKQRCQ